MKPEWLQLPAVEWKLYEGYSVMKKFVDKLPVANDSAERGIALIKQFINNVKDEGKRQTSRPRSGWQPWRLERYIIHLLKINIT